MTSKFSFYAFGIKFLLLLEFGSFLFLLDSYFLLCRLDLFIFFFLVVDVSSFDSLNTSSETEIANLDCAVFVEQNVGWLKVSMEHFSAV